MLETGVIVNFLPWLMNFGKKITHGTIILFHEAIYDKGHPKHKSLGQRAFLGRDVMVDLVKLLLEEYGDQFQFVTITEMLKHGKAERGKFV